MLHNVGTLSDSADVSRLLKSPLLNRLYLSAIKRFPVANPIMHTMQNSRTGIAVFPLAAGGKREPLPPPAQLGNQAAAEIAFIPATTGTPLITHETRRVLFSFNCTAIKGFIKISCSTHRVSRFIRFVPFVTSIHSISAAPGSLVPPGVGSWTLVGFALLPIWFYPVSGFTVKGCTLHGSHYINCN